MNHSDRGPLLLVVAGVLLILAVAAFLIYDAGQAVEKRRHCAEVRILESLGRIERVIVETVQ